MKAKAARTVKIVVGALFLVLGVAGLFLPILQGFLFLAVGLAILAPESPMAQRQLDRLRHRYPDAARRMDRARQHVKSALNRLAGRRPPD